MKKSLTILLPVLFYVGIFSLVSTAQTLGLSSPAPFVIDEDKEQFDDLINYFYLLKQPPSGLDFEGLVPKDIGNQFLPYQDFEQPLDRDQYYWGNFEIRNDLEHDVTYALYLGNMDFIEFYYTIGDDPYKQIDAGFLRPMSQRTDPDEHSQIVRFSIPQGETISCYIKTINKKFGSLEFKLELYTPRKIHQIINKEQRNLLQGIFQGILWIMIIYNLFFGILNKDRTYFYYAAYMFTLSLVLRKSFWNSSDLRFPRGAPFIGLYMVNNSNCGYILYTVFKAFPQFKTAITEMG